ncbi:unnamed protein product [Urochloa decumbens]|uniref:Glycosyl transferase CAP10 domain-containing protein n=1 Tax=Urochloa decumbens TaxID=240449 RepID=A0ABC8VZE8_9POAL
MKGPAISHEEEEETAALMAPPPPCPDDDGALLCKYDSSGSMAVDQTKLQGQSSTAKSWWTKVLPTRGIGLVMGVLVILALLAGTTSSGWTIHLGSSSFLLGTGAAGRGRNGRPPHHAPSLSGALRVTIPFTCGNGTSTAFPNCPRAAAPSPSPSPTAPPSSEQRPSPSPTCPDYFRYIHSDLSPWHDAGITREAVERSRRWATFRLVVVSGRAYVEKYRRAYQTRDVFTIWGILQLLARYPGRVPDLDLMFFCGDIPVVRARAYPDPSKAPPLFMYCTEDTALDIVFPDWTFWGWPEVNIRPWAPFLEEVARESRRVPWMEREPYAFWKGNPNPGSLRKDLMRCNASGSGGKQWNARLFSQDWGYANRNGFKDSNLAKQCTYRYKIYVQRRGWSVSQKYILACGSPMLRIDTPFKDFFSRGLITGRHYWPIDAARKCPSIKFAVDWGNAHPAQAQRMGEEGSSFTRDDLSMDYVYDYMLHLLTQYAGLLRYKPTVPDGAIELCLESMACPAGGRAREFMMESMEKYVADYEPCVLPQPFTADEITELVQRDEDVRSKVKKMEEQEERES